MELSSGEDGLTDEKIETGMAESSKPEVELLLGQFTSWIPFQSSALQMSLELDDFRRAIERLEGWVGKLDTDVMDQMVDLNFLYLFVTNYAYSNRTNDDATSSSSSSSRSSREKMEEALFIKAKELEISIHSAFVNGKLSKSLNVILASLNQQIDVLKADMREAYRYRGAGGSSSSLSIQSLIRAQPAMLTTCWKFFCTSLQESTQYLLFSIPYSLGSDPLRTGMSDLRGSVVFLCQISLSLYPRYNASAWTENMMIHITELLLQVADFCCFCWCNTHYAPLGQGQGIEQDVVTWLTKLLPQVDLVEFLDLSVGMLNDAGEYLNSSTSVYLDYVKAMDFGEMRILQDEILSLLFRVNKIPENHYNDIHQILVGVKDVVLEATTLQRRSRTHKGHVAILLAKIWSLQAYISVKTTSFMRPLVENGGYEALRRFLTRTDAKSVLEHQILMAPRDEESIVGQILMVTERVLNQVNRLDQFRSSKTINVNHIHLQLQVQVALLMAKTLFLELLKMDASPFPPLKHKIETLQAPLFFVTDVVTIKTTDEITEDELLMLVEMHVVASRVISFCDTFTLDNLTVERVKDMDVLLLDLLQKVRNFMPKLKGLYLQMPSFNLPKTLGSCSLEYLLRNLRDLLPYKDFVYWSWITTVSKTTFNDEGNFGAYELHLIENICTELESIISAFGDSFQQGFEEQGFEDLHTQLNDAAYLAEYMIDMMVLRDGDMRECLVGLEHLSEQIKRIKLLLDEFHNGCIYECEGRNNPQRLVAFKSHVTQATTVEAMVGLNDQKNKIIDQLTRGVKRDVVSITGMAGIGKTTMAMDVFCSPRVMHHFYIRAWFVVSQTYTKRDLLLGILSHIISITDSTLAMSDDDLQLTLYRKLKQTRYLIVLDDVWDTKAWEDLQLAFPNDSNGSRILITSRLEDVVSKISYPNPLPLLSEEESWQLLKLKIFPKEDCPENLLEVGQEISKNCKGLPLSIGAIAGLLRSTKKNHALWRQIAQTVSSHVINDPETRCKEILELSYRHLPHHLKACFLYFGAFPEDKDILVRKLRWLWIAEGFVGEVESKSAEDLAEEYFMDLVGRNLVMVAKRRSNGKVKTCRVHDVVRDLCLMKATEENFWQLISAQQEPYTSFDGIDSDFYEEFYSSSDSTTYKAYRLCFYVHREHFAVSKPSGPFARSLLYIATADTYPRCPYDVAFVFNNFKRLGVLDLESINMGSSIGDEIGMLLLLRYLAVCGDMEYVPPSLCKLQYLETLVIKGLKKKVKLPDSVWGMKKLRHVHITNRAIFTLLDPIYGSPSRLHNLVSLSILTFRCWESTDDMIMMFPNLRKLGCVVLDPQDVSMNFSIFPAWDLLSQLESLKVSYFGKVRKSGNLKFPSSLKKLTLSTFCLSMNNMSAIGRLGNLEVLKLMSCAFEESSWDMKEKEFNKLKYLELDNLNIVHWNACSDHLPELQQLVLRNCKQLEEVPFDFACISTLEKIEVQLCRSSVNESVRNIEEQFEGLKIVINNSYSA
ncbi:OLC1v1007450C1 [Oldenlandia corymbosa var. corymbosa]|uniref:OLC1v1007450C1 n=1 Tax=Oldenlandia corymbosa var. corymbosa TaxID=529605 RepID=A0AAV1DJB7_OLDCO|nr:OLC1v1007450C1 [Oldenlandia corymbosa var. corymbosa]